MFPSIFVTPEGWRSAVAEYHGPSTRVERAAVGAAPAASFYSVVQVPPLPRKHGTGLTATALNQHSAVENVEKKWRCDQIVEKLGFASWDS